MEKKVILISIDGMRPDGALQCGNPFVEEMMTRGSCALSAKTVFPSVTLPCHLSMFHSVPPSRHGTLTNTYAPPVRPVNGLLEQIKMTGKRSMMYYGWEPIREIGRCGSLFGGEYLHTYAMDGSDAFLTERAVCGIKTYSPDFVFLYLVETDDKGGHDVGWMTDTYLSYVSRAIDCAKRIVDEFGDDYTVIVTADHGGHERSHGTEMAEDMTIPMFFIGDPFPCGKAFENVSILDLAPTIAKIMQVPIPREWEGKPLIE